MKSCQKILTAISFALVLLLPFVVHATGDHTDNKELVLRAEAFVQNIGKGNLNAMEVDCAHHFKQGVQSGKFAKFVQKMTTRFGAFQGIGNIKTSVQNGVNTVTVDADFQKQIIGFAVTFNSAHKITQFRLVSPV